MAINCSLVRRKQLQEIKEGLDKRFKHLSDPVIENWVRMWRTYNNTAADPTAEDINKMLIDRADEMLNNTLNCLKSYASMFNSHLDEFNRMQQRGDIDSIRTQDVNQKLREVRNPENIGLDKDYIVIEGMSNIVAENNETFRIENANVDLIAVTPNGDVCIVNDSNVPAEVYEKQKEIINIALGPKFKGTVFGYTYSEDKGLTPVKDREYFASIPYNEKQKDAIEEATDFALNGNSDETFMIEGKAGTGKTTIAKEVVYKYSKEFEREFGRRPSIMMMALAHKAKEVLDESLGNLKTEVPNISLSTIASALGKREKVNQKGEITFETDPNVVELPIEKPDLIIIDESSMVSQEMLREVMNLKKSNAKVITLGDDGQLPPIEKSADTHSPTFDTKNKVQLFERVRQGEASPILPYADRFWEQGTSKTPNVTPFKIPLHDIVQPEGSLLVAKNRESVLNNLINAFKYAIKTGNYNYVKYIAYQNKTVDSMNELIHNAVAGDRINPNTGFADGEFILFKKPFYKDKDLIAPTSYEATIIRQGSVYTDSKGFKCCNITIKHKDEIQTIPVIVRQDLANYNAYLEQKANEISTAAETQNPRETKRMWAQYYAYIKEHADIDFAYALTSHKSQGSTYNISITDLNDIGGVQGPDASTKNKSAYVGITRAKNVAVVLTSNAVETTSRDFNNVNNKIQNKTLTESEITKDNSIPESNSSLTIKAEPIKDVPQSTDYMDSLVSAYEEEAKASNDMPTNISSVYSEMSFSVNQDENDMPSQEGIRDANEHFNDTQDVPSSMPDEENNEVPEEAQDIPSRPLDSNKQKQQLTNNKTNVETLKDEQEAAEAFQAQQRVAATGKITASDATALGMDNNSAIPDAIKPDADVEVIPTQSRRQEIKQVFTPAVRNELTTNVAEVFTEFLFEEIEEYKAELQNEQEQYRNANGKNDESITLKLEALEDKETCVPVYLEAKGVQNIIQRISETIDDRVSQYEEFAEGHPEQKERALMLRDRVANAKTYLKDLLADASVQIEEATGTRLSFDNKNGVITATANEDSATEEINDTEVDDNEEGDSTIAGGSELIEGVKYRFVDPFALMSKEVKMMLSRIEMADANIGKDNNWDEDHFVYGWLGNERHMPVKQTYAILLDAFSKYVNKPEDFYYKDDNDEYHFPVLDILKEQHYWARFLERNLRQALAEDNREILSKFYTAMRMDFITYDAIKHNDNDEVQSFSLNQKEKANGIMKEAVANTVNGIRLTLNDVYTHDAETCINNAKSALEKNKQTIEVLNYIRTANVNEDLAEYIESAVTLVHEALAKLGIDIHPAVIRSVITNTRGQSTVKTPIIEIMERVNQIMQRISKNKSLNEADAKDNQGKISDFRNIVNNQRYDYSWLCRMFSDFSELNNESSFKSTDGKKNYQSYSTPNFMGDLVHTFTNYDSWKRKAESLSDDYFIGKQILKVKQSYDENEKSTAVWIPVGKNEKIKLQDKIDILVREYLMEKYGNKEWYYKEGKWRNSVLELFYCNASKIMSDGSLMSKKELIEIDGETYRDWTGSMISKSMLERYFKDNVTLNDIIRQDGSIMDHLNITSFNTPILADSPVCMLNMQERVCSEYDPENPDAEVLSRFRDIVKQEIDRIKLVKARKKAKASPIANFDSKGEKFCFFPSLNDGFFDKYTELETKASEETLNSVIDARIKGIIEDTLREERKSMNLEVIKSNSDFKTDEEAIKAYNAFVVNGMLARTALIELTTVDLAFYKDWTDFQKRFKEIYANGKKLDTNSRYGKKMERVIYLKDLTGMSRQFSKLKAILDRAVKAGEMKSYDRDNFLFKFRDINATDAQSFRTLSSLRAVMDMVGNWNKRQQRAFENLQHGIFNPQDLDIAWQTIKPYMFTIVDKNDGLGGKISVPHQNKNSEFLLLTMFNVIGSSTKSPMMAGLNRFMEKNDIDVATFESAVKAGCEGAIDISHSTVKDKNGKTKLDRWIDSHNDEWARMLEDLKEDLKDEQKFNSMSNWDKYLQASMVQFDKGIISQEQYNERMDAQEPSEQEVYDMLEDNVFIKDDKGNPTSMPNPDVLHELPYDNYCIQQPTPEHLFDAEVIFGSQFRNLIIADLPDTEKFKKLKEDYIRAINMNLQESFDKVKKLFTGKNGMIKLQKKLLEQIKGNPKYGREIEAALELVEITDDYGNKRVDFNIPLDNPNTTIGMQELLLSVFKNQITKQHIKGAACVLVSNVGYTKELNIVYNEDGNKDSGVKHIECYLPAASKRFYQPFLKENADGSVELDYSKLPEDLKQGIGYRIPTESKYSMIPLYIKGFLPQQNGSAIMLPEEITTMAGSDFDIDKLFMILPEFYEKKTYDYKKAWSDFYDANPELNKAINKAQWNSFKENLKQLKETNPEAADKYDFTKEFKDWFVENSGVKKYEWVEGTKDRFNEWFDQNKDNYILKTEFKRVKDGFDSREARNNLILTISHTILTSKEIAPQLLRAGNFDEAKMLARIASIIDNQDLLNAFMEKQGIDITEAEEAKIRQNFDDEQAVIERRKLLVKKTKELLNQIMKDHNLKLVDSFFKKYVKQNNPLTLGGFISNHEQNMLGGKMIGIYANNTTQQAKYQNSGLRLKDEFVFTFNGRKVRECDLVKNFNEEYVSQNCAQFSAASVDNAKDPILKALYQNPDTANITGFLLRAGFTLQEASLIFAHPVFRNMYEQGKLTANAVKKEFDNANKARGLESVDITDYDFTSYELLQQILESRLKAEDLGSEEHQSGQIRFLGLLYKVLAGAEAINSLTMNSRSDSPNGAAKPRISMVDNQLFRIDQLNYSFNNPNFALTGVRNLVSNTMDESYIAESKTPMLQAFHSYGLASIPSLLQGYFVQYIPEVRRTVNALLEQSPRKNRDMLLQNFYQQLVEYALTNTDLFGTTEQSTLEEKRQYYIYDFPAEFLKVVASKPELKDSGLFKVLTVKEGDLRYTGNTNNPIAFQYLQDQMEDLLYSNDLELKKLATDLFMYSFYKEGLSYGGNSVGKLFSTSFLTSIPEYINTVRNVKVIAKNPEFMHKFVSQFLANNTEIACTSLTSVKRQKDSVGNIAINAKYAVNKNILGKGRTDEPMLYEYISIDGGMYVLRGVNNKKAIYSPAPTFNRTNTGEIKESYYNARSTVEAMIDNKIDDNAVKRNKQTGVKKSSYLDSIESYPDVLEGYYSDVERSYYDKETKTGGNFLDDVSTQQEYPQNEDAVNEILCKKE